MSPQSIFGLLIVAMGLAAGIIGSRYSFGTLTRMGPGYFPIVLSSLLVALGLWIAWSERKNTMRWPETNIRALASIALAVIAFGLTVRPLGFVAAVMLLVVLSWLAQPRPKLFEAAIAGLVLAAFTYVVFVQLLGLNLRPFTWGFR